MIVSRVWAMPNKETFTILPIRDLVRRTMESVGGFWIDPFAGNSKLAHVTNDLKLTFATDSHLPAHAFLATFPDESVDGVILDPPYSPTQLKRSYDDIGRKLLAFETQSAFYRLLREQTARIVRPGGKAITCGWNSTGIGQSRRFEKQVILLVCHGGSHNDTIVTVERKDAFYCAIDSRRLHSTPNCKCKE